ncbi:hypothetical protein, partial [Pseudomonas sp. NCHU5232]|uniref:hypothetical protein n=1 Tax=Pseudomonas sp. NCHU5232 TaxID=3451356 RepID=UPI003F94AF04
EVLVTFAPKVTRPGGRNQKHQQKRGKPEQAPEQPTSYTQTSQSGIRADFPRFHEEPRKRLRRMPPWPSRDASTLSGR